MTLDSTTVATIIVIVGFAAFAGWAILRKKPAASPVADASTQAAGQAVLSALAAEKKPVDPDSVA